MRHPDPPATVLEDLKKRRIDDDEILGENDLDIISCSLQKIFREGHDASSVVPRVSWHKL